MRVVRESLFKSTEDTYLNMEKLRKKRGENVLYVIALSDNSSPVKVEAIRKEHRAMLFNIKSIETGIDERNTGILGYLSRVSLEYRAFRDGTSKNVQKLYERTVPAVIEYALQQDKIVVLHGLEILYMDVDLHARYLFDRPMIVFKTSALLAMKANGHLNVDKSTLVDRFKELGSYILDKGWIDNASYNIKRHESYKKEEAKGKEVKHRYVDKKRTDDIAHGFAIGLAAGKANKIVN